MAFEKASESKEEAHYRNHPSLGTTSPETDMHTL